MANTKITFTELNFKINEDHTLVELKFKTDNDPALGTVRRNKFPVTTSIVQIIAEELNDFKYLSWPDGDHKPKMKPIDYRLISEVCEFICDLGMENYRMSHKEVTLHNTHVAVSNALKPDGINIGEEEMNTLKDILSIIENTVPLEKIHPSKFFEVSQIVTTHLILKRFKV